jgi:regulatory factor X, other
VLRSVALSINSVAASVEPVMQQQFFSLSPMAGQENFNSMDVRPPPFAHTPTTSSMLAALQNDFPSSLDPANGGFSDNGYGYMDTSAPQDDTLPAVHASGLAFPDFSAPGNSFDVSGFSQDLGMQATATPANETEHVNDTEAKVDQPPAAA